MRSNQLSYLAVSTVALAKVGRVHLRFSEGGPFVLRSFSEGGFCPP